MLHIVTNKDNSIYIVLTKKGSNITVHGKFSEYRTAKQLFVDLEDRLSFKSVDEIPARQFAQATA